MVELGKTTVKKMKRIIIFILILISLPAIHAFDEEVGGNMFITAHFENATKINQERVPSASFTTLQNHTFHYENAYKITYKNPDGKMDYFITWSCNVTDDYYALYDMHDLNYFYSDYTVDNKVVYMEIPPSSDYVYGIILDTQNISYTEADLVHGILDLDYVLSNDTYDVPTAVNGGFGYSQGHYNGPVIEPYELARNDPWAYYDHFDYEDNVDIDEYLYDEGYDE